MSESTSRFEKLFDEGHDLAGSAREAWLAKLESAGYERAAELRELLDGLVRSAGFLESGPHRTGGPHVGERLGEYELLEELGRGGMGVVFRARGQNPARDVALKLLASPWVGEEQRQRFEMESRALARLSHPGIAQVFASGAAVTGSASTPWIAMELIREPQSLTAHAQRAGLDGAGILRLVLPLCEAVAHAHRCGVLHRDLKPANVLVDGEGHVKVIDFGIARLDQADALATRAGQLVGTLAYMAPEQAGGSAAVDARADVHGIGALLYELLCGRMPRDLAGESLTADLLAISTEPPAPAVEAERRLGPDIRWVLERALALDPEDRYPSVDALAADLRAILDGLPVSVGPPGLGYVLSKFAARHRILVGATALVAVALVTSTVVSSLALRRALTATAQLEDEQRETRAALDRAEQERARALDSRDFLTELISAPSPYGDGVHVRVADLLDDRAKAIEAALSEDPELAVEQRLTLAVAYRGLGLDQRAIDQLDPLLEPAADGALQIRATQRFEALSLRSKALHELGRYDLARLDLEEALETTNRMPRTGEILSQRVEAWADVARVLCGAGDSNQALERLEEAEVESADLPPEHPARSLLDHTLGFVHYKRGEWELARTHYQAALDRRVETLGPHHPFSLASTNGLALVELAAGEIEPAVDRFEALHPKIVEVYGPLHAKSQQVAGNLASAWLLSGRSEEAVELARSTAERIAERLGPQTRSYFAATYHHAMALAESGQPGPAADLMALVLEDYLERLGPEHAECSKVAVQLARQLDQSGAAAEAAGAFERALELVRASEGPTSLWALETAAECANAWIQVERLDEAIALVDEVLPIVQAELASDHELNWKLPNCRGGAQLRGRDYESAAASFEAALAGLAAEQPEQDSTGLLLLANLAAALRGLGDDERSIEMLDLCARGRTELHGAEAPATLVAETNLAWAEYLAGRYGDAQLRYAEALGRAETTFPPGHWMPAYWKANLASCHSKLGEYQPARELLEASVETLRTALGPENSRTLAVERALAKVLVQLEEQP